MSLTKIDPADYKLYLELTGNDLKLFKWLLTKSLKAGDSLLWLDAEESGGAVYGRVKHKGNHFPLQAWACFSASNQGSSDCSIFMSMPVQEIRQAIKESEAGHKDEANRVLIALDGSGLIWVNRKRIGGNKMTMAELAAGLFVQFVDSYRYEIPHGRPAGNPLAAIMDYQMILQYVSGHAASPTDPVRYEMAFVWVNESVAMTMDNLRICAYRRSTRDSGDDFLIAIRSDVFAAEKKAKAAYYFGNDDGISSSICFTTECDHGFSWEAPEKADSGLCMDTWMGKLDELRDLPAKVTFSVKPVLTALKEQIKAAGDAGEIPLTMVSDTGVWLLGRSHMPHSHGDLSDGKLVAQPDYDDLLKEISPIYIFSKHLFALLNSLSVEYCDLRFGELTGKVSGAGLYASEGRHLEVAFMPCTTIDTPKGDDHGTDQN